MQKKVSFFKDKNFAPLIAAVFILSVFIGIILSIVIKQWLVANIDFVKSIQTKEESKQFEKLLDKVR